MYCIRHKGTELVNGVCSECGWTEKINTPVVRKPEPIKVNKPVTTKVKGKK